MPPPAEGLASRLFLGPALRTQSDRRLIALVREGYESAFEEIVRRYGRPLGRYAASIVGGRSEDVTQDAFSKALQALRRSDTEIELRPWLFRIVRNTALNELRDSPPSPEVLAEAIAGGSNPAEELERREELADLMRRLQALPEPQRAAIVMRELEGLGHEEIAAALGLTGGGARQAIYRARRALRDGIGMLVPLPLLQSLLAGAGPGVAETAGAAGMGAAGLGGAAGAGVVLKATAATVLVAGAVGAGVALENGPSRGDADAAPARVDAVHAAPTPPGTAEDTSFSRGGDSHGGDRHGSGSGETEPGDDRNRGHGGRGEGDRASEREPSDDHGGRGARGEMEPRDNRSGHDGSAGRQEGGSSRGSGEDSGHGEESGSGHSGPGSGGTSGSGGSSGPGSDGSEVSESGLGGSSGPGPSGDSGDGGGPGPSEESSSDGATEPEFSLSGDSGGGDGLSG
jgi:RNA polymerase sigma factor (sigma-70 family)